MVELENYANILWKMGRGALETLFLIPMIKFSEVIFCKLVPINPN